MKRVLGTAFFSIFALFGALATAEPFDITVDRGMQTYTIVENGVPALTYKFGEVPVPDGLTVPHFGKGPTDYDGAYFSDGSAYGGPRSDYIEPLYGFSGEILTTDYPKDHLHHRGLWWSWCEVRRGKKIGDIWAVCKIRAYPSEMTRMETDDEKATLEAVNLWRYDDDPTDVVRETVTITAHRTEMLEGAKCRAIDVDIKLEALVGGMAITGRQKVDYGGYGGMTIRLNGAVEDFALRAVHPKPDTWSGDNAAFVERISDPAKYGDAAWLSLFGRFPAPNGKSAETTIQMMEKKSTPLYPNNFRYYGTTCTSLAFPAKQIVPLEKGKPLIYRTRVTVTEGKSSIEAEKKLFDVYQAE